MRAYLSHASDYDYRTELYEPLKESLAIEHDIFFPHDEHDDGVLSKDIIPACDVLLAEVSRPSTGQGIELGWADANNVPVICFYRKGAKISSALRFIGSTIIEYETQEGMSAKVGTEISKIK